MEMTHPPSAPAAQVPPSRLYTPEEAAAELRVSRRTVFVLIGSGQLRSVKVGARRLIARAHLDEFIAGGGTAA